MRAIARSNGREDGDADDIVYSHPLNHRQFSLNNSAEIIGFGEVRA
jgi:hypothetical protein